MESGGLTLFDTAVGRCGLSWGLRGIVGLQLPEASDAATTARLARRYAALCEAAPPADIRAVIDRVTALIAGAADDLADIDLDMTGIAPFHRRVYEATRRIAPGETTTYGALAAAIGQPDAAQAIGSAMAQNPFPIVVPCHRVLAAGGRIGGFSAHGGRSAKRRLLAIESRLSKTPTLFDGLLS